MFSQEKKNSIKSHGLRYWQAKARVSQAKVMAFRPGQNTISNFWPDLAEPVQTFQQ